MDPLRILAFLYVAFCIGALLYYAIRKADKYFWKGVIFGLFIVGAYLLFFAAMKYLISGEGLL